MCFSRSVHGQAKIQMLHAPKAWEVGEPMVDEKCFNNITQIWHFHRWYLQQVKRSRLMFGFQYKQHDFYYGDGEPYIMWDEIYTLLKGSELRAQIIRLWEL
jgi:hypothetical protein